MGSSTLLGPDHPLARAESRLRTLQRAARGDGRCSASRCWRCSRRAGVGRAASGARRGGRLGALLRRRRPVRPRQPARASARADRERPRGVAAAGRRERAHAAERSPLPPPPGAHAGRDPCRAATRTSGGRPCTPTATRCTPRATSCTEVARLLRELPNVRARGVALVTRLIRDGATSPLYRGPAPRLREELGRIRHVLIQP